MGPHAFAPSCLHSTPVFTPSGRASSLRAWGGSLQAVLPPVSCLVAFKRWGQGNLRLFLHGAATLWWLNKVALGRVQRCCDAVIKLLIRSFPACRPLTRSPEQRGEGARGGTGCSVVTSAEARFPSAGENNGFLPVHRYTNPSRIYITNAGSSVLDRLLRSLTPSQSPPTNSIGVYFTQTQ